MNHGQNKTRQTWQSRTGPGANFNHRRGNYSQPKPLPPYAKAIEWKRQAGRETPTELVHIVTGSRGAAEASALVDREKYWGDKCRVVEYRPLAVLPFEKNPSFYDWSFAKGLQVAIETYGEPETDTSLLYLMRLLIESGAHIVALSLSDDRLELFKPGERGTVWRLN